MDPFTDIVFSWSLEDVLNEDLYKNKVEKIPETFQSIQHYFGSYSYPLLEETRAQVHSSMETIYRAPFAKVVAFEESKQYGTKLYDIQVDDWQNRFSDRGKEPYKTLPGDLFVLAESKPETISDLRRVGRSWAFASVTSVSVIDDEDDSSPVRFKVKALQEFKANNSTQPSLFVVFLVNLTTNRRIWKSLHMSRNLKIFKEVLCTDYVAQKNYDHCIEKKGDILDKRLLKSVSSGLNESQTGAVLACLKMRHCDAKSALELIWGPPGTGKTKTIVTLLFTLLRMNCRTLICAPTNVAITVVASRVRKMVTEAGSKDFFCSLGEILLFGNKDRLKVGQDIEDIYLDYRVKRLAKCLEPQAGWRHCFASMIDFLENCVSHYHFFLENELTKEKEQNNVFEMKEKECKSDTEVSKGKCKIFLEFFRDGFVSAAVPLRSCISTFCTHIARNYISVQKFHSMISLIDLVHSYELMLFEGNVVSESLEDLFSRSEVEEISESVVDNSFLLCMKRRECLSALRTLQDSLGELTLLENYMEQESLRISVFKELP